MVCWIMTFKKRRHSRGGVSGPSGRHHVDREQYPLGHCRSSSAISVTRISGVDSHVDSLFTNGWSKSGEIQDPGLPTPEQTPLQHKRPTPDIHDHTHLDPDWDQSQIYIAQTGPGNIMYLSSDYLQDVDGEDNDDLVNVERQRYLILARPAIQKEQLRHYSAVKARKSASEYQPPMPQDSPERRKVVSAPNPHSDYGNAPHWTQNGIVSSSAKVSRHHNYPIQPRTNAALIRPGVHHASRGLGEHQEFSHRERERDRHPSGQ